MICVEIVNDGNLSFISPSPVQSESCAYVLTTPGELSPWAMSKEQATELAVAIGLLWGLAFVFRVFTRFIQYTR